MIPRIVKVFRDNYGVAALEYALIAGLMFTVIISAFTAANLGPSLNSAFSNIVSTLTLHSSGS